MRFIVSSTKEWLPDRLIKKYPCLDDYGRDEEKVPDNPNWPKTYINLYSLDELIEFQNKVEHGLIISRRGENEYTIEIYDDYRE